MKGNRKAMAKARKRIDRYYKQLEEMHCYLNHLLWDNGEDDHLGYVTEQAADLLCAMHELRKDRSSSERRSESG